jgi:undecaprenyl diphosphate synthase
LWFTSVMWPEFDHTHLSAALQAFRTRERRFGGLVAQAR